MVRCCRRHGGLVATSLVSFWQFSLAASANGVDAAAAFWAACHRPHSRLVRGDGLPRLQALRRRQRRPFLAMNVSPEDDADNFNVDDSDDDGILAPQQQQQSSRMFRYVADFLKQQQQQQENSNHFEAEWRDTERDSYTHLIAVPMDSCHELLLELESVQRGILYHCPILVHACIAGSMTRLPLLYVQVPPDESSTSATQTLQKLAQQAVNQHVWKAADDDCMAEDDENATLLNVDGIRPVTVQFQSLEIGIDSDCLSPNEVLYTVADPHSTGTKTLQTLVHVLQKSIAQRTGWRTLLPPHDDRLLNNKVDNCVEIESSTMDMSSFTNSTPEDPVFQPRIPFMRLPDDWERHLEEQVKQDDAIDETFMLTADQGGNGISPILWGQWCEDVFGSAQRLREVAIYQRSSSSLLLSQQPPSTTTTTPGRLSEQEFPVPAASVPLPAGTAAQSKDEARYETYQEQRMIEAEAAWKAERDDAKQNEKTVSAESGRSFVIGDDGVPEDDMLLVKTRERLEKLYRRDDDDAVVEKYTQQRGDDEDTDNGLDWNDIQGELSEPSQRDADPTIVDDWTRQRIEKVVQSRARVQSELALANKKAKSLSESNSVFEKYKAGTLVPEKDKVVPAVAKVLPPFPSREHCIGFWRMVGSPTGFVVEEGDAYKSDNLVLRVDGTTAGGPILDQETRQKASGGSWRIELLSEDMDQNLKAAILRIRLIIPPKKERILVMEGRLEKISMKVAMPLTANNFGIPALEELATNSATASDVLEDLLYCSGSVWIEDATTKENRDDIGKFSMMKLSTPNDPSQFTITIPNNVRNQD